MWKADERRQQLLAMLEDGEDETLNWDSLAIKVRARCHGCACNARLVFCSAASTVAVPSPFHGQGTSQELEKSYFRLTSAPAPATVRQGRVRLCELGLMLACPQATADSHVGLLWRVQTRARATDGIGPPGGAAACRKGQLLLRA